MNAVGTMMTCGQDGSERPSCPSVMAHLRTGSSEKKLEQSDSVFTHQQEELIVDHLKDMDRK